MLVLLAIGLVVKPSIADSPATEESPAIVYVAVQRGELYSGPDEDFYPTGYLAQGTSLEVYHRTDNNWLGVRPPAGSFSWVPAADAYLLPGGRVIEITSQSAVSWIGTALGSAKQYRWQVQLKPGEQLSVIGEKTTHDAQGKEVLWYQIAPPAGEFRWIHAKTVSSKPVVSKPTVEPERQDSQSKQLAENASQLSQPKEKRQPKLPAASSLGKAQTPGKSRGSLAPDTAESAQVVTAAYQGDASEGVITLGQGDDYYDDGPLTAESYADGRTFEGTVFEGGEYIEGEYVEGSYPYEEYFEGELPHGQIIYEDGHPIEHATSSGSNDPFAGWHAMELGDDGMRFTWLERLYGRARQQGPDPLAEDPFSLAMSRGTVQPASPRAIAQMLPAATSQEFIAPAPTARHRPWRDPRTLRSGFSSRGSGSPISAPPLSSRESSEFDSQRYASTPSNNVGTFPGRLTSATTPSTGNLAASPSAAGGSAAGGVNWYGVSESTNNDAGAATQSTNLNLSQLQLTLSEVVTQPMQTWRLQPIYDSALYYVEHGASAIERGQARLLIERVEEFAELAQRSGYLPLNRSSIANASLNSNGSVSLAASSNFSPASVVTTDFQRAINPGTNYDATGWLVPVIAASPGQPTHALSDEKGNILAYVSAIPGLNLDRYLNQAVGVTGLRGYLPQLQAGHIQAQRVVRLP